jgi:hypothetical protein
MVVGAAAASERQIRYPAMAVPERYWRFPTRAAIDALVARFGLPYDPLNEDWDAEGFDPAMLPAMLAALEGGELTDDEQFLLGSKVMATFNEMAVGGTPVGETDEWRRFVSILRRQPALHAWTLECTSTVYNPDDATWGVTPLVRPLWAELKPRAEAG